jgi:hypothetical protein
MTTSPWAIRGSNLRLVALFFDVNIALFLTPLPLIFVVDNGPFSN